jgi:hypothetical protein
MSPDFLRPLACVFHAVGSARLRFRGAAIAACLPGFPRSSVDL